MFQNGREPYHHQSVAYITVQIDMLNDNRISAEITAVVPFAQAGITGPLERDSERSLYEQLVDRLRQHVLTSGAAHGRLPTEDELTRLYGISRATVRKAINHLVEEKILVRRRGKGTFITRPLPSIVHAIDRVAPFFETFRQAGEDFHTEVTHFQWDDGRHLPPELSQWERPILNIQRLYVSGTVPHAVTRIALPAQIGRRITREEISSAPIYDVLRNKLKLEPQRAEFLVACRQASTEICESLEISRSTFLLVLDRITRDAAGNAIETMTHFLRPDVYKLSVASDLTS